MGNNQIMKCPECGNENHETSASCEHCGFDFKENKPLKGIDKLNLTAIKNTIFAWAFAAWELWKKNPLFLLGFGLVMMILILIPGLNILALLLSGALSGVLFSSLKMIADDEIPTVDKMINRLKHLWVYLVLIQIIALVLILLASILFWFPALIVGTFLLFIIPLAIEKPASIQNIFEQSFLLSKQKYITLFIILTLLAGINYLIFAYLPVVLCFTVPFSYAVIYISFVDLYSTVTENLSRVETGAFSS